MTGASPTTAEDEQFSGQPMLHCLLSLHCLIDRYKNRMAEEDNQVFVEQAVWTAQWFATYLEIDLFITVV